MSVLNRPMFRQDGGPAAPMPQDITGPPYSGENYDKPFPDEPFQGERYISPSNRVFIAMSRMIEPGDAASTPEQALQEAASNLSAARTQKEADEIKLATERFFLEFAAKAGVSPQKQMEILDSPLARSIQNFKLAPPYMRYRQAVEAGFIEGPEKRAMGGEMMAPPMPPMAAEQMMAGAPPPPELAMLEQAEAGAMAQGEELGAAYAQQMMAGIDGAQSTEDLINALRGNEMTLGDRRDELAEYVGQSDADKTPESVLAMVQPVIMMTEEGMMNSGIGALVQQIAGDVDMATEGGQPTDMGMGVGSLMMAGAQEAPAPQNFRQGGAVQKFDEGGAALAFSSEAKAAYEGLAPLFAEILLEEDRAQSDKDYLDFLKTQASLSAARGGLKLMAGVPDAGSSLVSQIGGAFADTATDLSKLGVLAQTRKESERKQDRALDLARLQAGISFTETERAARAKAEQARLDRQTELNKFVLGRDTKLYIDPDDLSAKPQAVLDIPTTINAAVQQGLVPYQPMSDREQRESLARRLLDGGANSKYATNDLKGVELYELERFLTDEYQTKVTFDEVTGDKIDVYPTIPPVILEALTARRTNKLSIPSFNLSQLEEGGQQKPPPEGDGATQAAPGVSQPEVPADNRSVKLQKIAEIAETNPIVAELADITRGGADFNKGLGVPGALRRFREKVINLFTISQAGPMSPEVQEFQSQVKGTTTDTIAAMVADLDEKSARDQRELIASVLPVQIDLDESSSTYGKVLDIKNISPSQFKADTKSLVTQLKTKILKVENDISDPTLTRDVRNLRRRQLSSLKKSLQTWEGILLLSELGIMADDGAIGMDRSASQIESDVNRAFGS